MALLIAMIALPMLGQAPPPRQRVFRPVAPNAEGAESAVKQAAEQLAAFRKVCERDVDVLRHLRAADAALTDPMQPTVAVQKAVEEVDKAKSLQPEFVVLQGVIKVQRELESAQRSPVVADFGHLRAVLRDNAVGPASRVAVRDALRLQEETAAWLRVEQLIADHLRNLSDIAGATLRASEQP
jgi:hypothetical protein